MYYPYIDRYQFYENLPIYILLTIILIILSIFIYIKLTFPFWNIQPVYHSYDFWRALYSKPFIIHKRFSTKMINRYCDLKQVEIVPFVDATIDQKKEFINLLQCYHLSSENSIFVFHLENLESYFGGHMFSTYISFFKQIHYKKDETEVIQTQEPLGCISSRSGELFIKDFHLHIYYIDYLCVKRDIDNKNISRKLLQTHIYKQQLIDKIEFSKHENNEQILVSLFRRERELLVGIVPIARFQTMYYKIPNMNNIPALVNHFILIEINETNMNTFIEFLEESNNNQRFSIYARTDISNLIGLIKSGILYVYCLKRLDEIYGIYVFRDTRSNYENLGSVLQLVCSICNTSSHDLFINGFLHSIKFILKKIPVYNVLMVDEISDNILLMDSRVSKTIDTHWTAYYLYNMIVPFTNNDSSKYFILF